MHITKQKQFSANAVKPMFSVTNNKSCSGNDLMKSHSRRDATISSSYLIFVTSINSSASVKKLTEWNFFHNLREKDS